MSIAAPRGTNIVSGEAGHTGVAPFWRSGIAFAIAVHAAVAAGVVFWQFGHEAPQESAAAFTIDLAPMVSAAPVPETNLPEGPKEEETLEEIVEPAPLPEPPLPRDAIAEPEKKPEPVKKEVQEAAKKEVKEATAPRAQDVSVAPQTTAPANAAPSNADACALPTYEQTLTAHLKDHQDYPRNLRRRHVEGVVKVRFKIDRSGNLLAVSVAESSGSSLLDQAGIDTVKRAEPLPPLPDAISGPTLEVTTPIRFNLEPPKPSRVQDKISPPSTMSVCP